MIIRLYTDFAKRRNSTKIPELGTGTEFEGELKQEFALTGLTVRFAFTDPRIIPPYNYAYISAFRRYYYLTEWYFDSGYWYAVMAEDVLASWRDEIGESTQYITRRGGLGSLSSGTLIDPNVKSCGPVTRAYTAINPEDFWGAGITTENGLVVIGTVGNSAGSVGAVSYYGMTMVCFRNFLNSMLSSPSWMNISTTEVSAELQRAIINPTQYIVYCRWFPLPAAAFIQQLIPQAYGTGTVTRTLALGWWSFALTEDAVLMNTVGSGWIYRNALLTIPKHPGSNGTGQRFLDLSPYSTYMLEVPPFGVFEIDSTELLYKEKLMVDVNFSLLTGDAVLKLIAVGTGETADSGKAFLVYEGQVGVQLPIAQVSGNINNYKSALSVGAIAGLDAILGGGG